MALNVILAILVLSVIIIIHEFGHFIIAKANGVAVEEFCLGFGPKLIHFKIGETEYSLRLLLFGGACIMQGADFIEDPFDKENDESDELDEADETADDETDKDEDRTGRLSQSLKEGFDAEKSFSNKSVWSRIAIVAAGPVFNFLLAFVLAVIIIGCLGYDPAVINKVYDNSPASVAGLQEGDEIISINGDNISFAREYSFYRYYHASKAMNITYKRDGNKYSTTLNPEYTSTKAYKLGVVISNSCVISTVSEDSAASKAGIKVNDIIKSVDGNELADGTQLSEIIGETKGNTIPIVVSRDGEEINLNVTPELVESEAYYTGLVCYGQRIKTSPLGTIGESFKEVGYWIETVIKSVGMMFTGQVGINDLSGPVGTVSVMSSVVGESRSEGVFSVVINLCNLALMISANLGVMNLLPIPGLDGGRLVFFILEVLRGKPVKKEHEGMVHFVGMVLLMILMVYVLFKDIVGLF